MPSAQVVIRQPQKNFLFQMAAKEAGFQTEELEIINPDELLQAEELFLFDACNGIQKVLGLEDRRYFSPKTKLIAAKLSELAKKDRDDRITNY